MIEKPEDRRQAFQNLGACYLALEQYDDALTALDEAKRYAADDPDILHSRGVTYACAGRIPEAIASFEQFARSWPRQAWQQEIQDALRQLRRAHRGEISPGDYLVDHLQEQAIHNVELGDWHLVERKARRTIDADGGRPEGHFALGVACLEQDRCPEALEAFQAAHTGYEEKEHDGCRINYRTGAACLPGRGILGSTCWWRSRLCPLSRPGLPAGRRTGIRRRSATPPGRTRRGIGIALHAGGGRLISEYMIECLEEG